uniref:RING-type domain-containing protein n=1 Tax=Peronospora matthiolae TaxID=2874970 RepID=A0AAV1TTI9_9STRA
MNRRLSKRPLGLTNGFETRHLAQEVAHVVALSLQQNARSYHRHRLSTSVMINRKQGLLASTLQRAEQNVSDMTNYLQRVQETTVAAIGTSRVQSVVEVGPRATSCDHMCVICMDGDMTGSKSTEKEEEGESVTALPCGHVFHAHCIEQWLQYRQVCPIDRMEIVSDDTEGAAI